MIADALTNAVGRGVSIRVLFGREFGLTEADAVRMILDCGIAVKCYRSQETYHPKAYVFERGSVTSAIIGSANLSASGLTSGREWSVLVRCKGRSQIRIEFDRLWSSLEAEPATEDMLSKLKEENNQLTRSVGDLERDQALYNLAETVAKEDQPLRRDEGNSAIGFAFTVGGSFKK